MEKNEKSLEQLSKEWKKNKKTFWNLKKEFQLQEEKNQIQIKFYFWDWCSSYGWRQIGNLQGYNSLKELKKENSFSINGNKKYPGSKNWKILKAKVIEQKII